MSKAHFLFGGFWTISLKRPNLLSMLSPTSNPSNPSRRLFFPRKSNPSRALVGFSLRFPFGFLIYRRSDGCVTRLGVPGAGLAYEPALHGMELFAGVQGVEGVQRLETGRV